MSRAPMRAGARALLAALVLLAVASTARADEVDRCLAAHAQSQRLRIEGKLRASEAELLVCAAEACPRIVRAECGDALVALRNDIPTIVVDADDASGRDVLGVRLVVDGGESVETFRGTALEIDPGTHELRFEAPGELAVVERVLIRQGEKNRVVAVTFRGRERPTTAHEAQIVSAAPRPIPVASIALGAVGVAGAATFAALALSARSDVEHLRMTCEPRCASSDVDRVRTKLVIADVSAGIGVVALAAATWLFFARVSATPSATSAFDLRVGADGVSASFARAF